MPPPHSPRRVPEGKYILNFLYLDPGGVKGEVLTSVTSALRWAGSLPVLEQPAANLLSASTGLDRPPSCLPLHSFPDPALSCDFTQSPGRSHSPLGLWHHLSLSYCVQSLHKVLPHHTHSLSVAPSLRTPAGSHLPAQLSNPWGVPNPRSMTSSPAGRHKGGRLCEPPLPTG